jgi:hypothetical protein
MITASKVQDGGCSTFDFIGFKATFILLEDRP